MVLPGTYSVRVSKRVNGVVTPLSQPQTFTVKPLHDTPEATTDRSALLAFQQDTADMLKVVLSATAASSEMRNRLAHLKLSVETLTSPNDSLRARIQRLETMLDDADLALNGDRTISSRNEPAPWSINARLSQIRNWGWATQAPQTISNRTALTVAKHELDEVLGKLRDVEAGLVALEDQFEQSGAPYTPSRGVPNWRLQE